MNRINRSLIVSIFGAGLALLSPVFASAHEHRDIAEGNYSVVVGFSSEPAYSGFLNGLSLDVSDLSQASPTADGEEAEGVPVEGLEESLQAEVIFGDEKMALTLEPRWQFPGSYDAWLVPMAAGDYTFHIFGTIGDTAIDESFTSSPEGFSSVIDQATIQFPKAAATGGAAPVFGTVADESGSNTGLFGGLLAGLVAGATGIFMIQRRKSESVRATLVTRAGAGD